VIVYRMLLNLQGTAHVVYCRQNMTSIKHFASFNFGQKN